MAGLFSRLFGRQEVIVEPEPNEVEIPPLAVDKPFAAIGDVHGRFDLLEALLTKLASEAPNAQLLFVGDYIDRGEESAQVLRRIMQLDDAICLMGNHERMCLDFIENPEEKGPRWMRNGGLQTVASFDVSGSPSDFVALRDAMVAEMGDEMVTWLKALKLWHKAGNVYAVHAAAHPEKPIEGQGEKPLIWGHSLFRKQPRIDGQWVVHGHTIVDTPTVSQGVISIDTGAYATGRLTAAIFEGGDVQMIQA